MDTYLVADRGEEIVRRYGEVINRSESVDAVMAELEELMHPDIELVNPEDAIEGGTRKGLAGMRTATENFFDGAGRAATVEVEEVHERGDRVFVRLRVHARGSFQWCRGHGTAHGHGLHYPRREDLQDRVALRR